MYPGAPGATDASGGLPCCHFIDVPAPGGHSELHRRIFFSGIWWTACSKLVYGWRRDLGRADKPDAVLEYWLTPVATAGKESPESGGGMA